MPNLSKLLSLARTRNGLLVMVGVLLLLNAVRLVYGKYAEFAQAVESKQALLVQYRMSTKDIEAVRARIRELEARKAQIERHLFQGASEKDVTSAMQIRLQELLAQVGMNPESVSAIAKGARESGSSYGEVSIKVRLGGTLESFVNFLAALYKLDTLLRVENFTVKPFKKEELKIFLELKGYYRLIEPQANEAAKGPPQNTPRKKGDLGRKGGSQP